MASINEVGKILGGFISKNSSTILSGVAIGGVITTAIFAGKGAIKADYILFQAKSDKANEMAENGKGNEKCTLTPKEVVQATWKLYLPALLSGGATIACIIGANQIGLRRQAALAGAYSLTEAAFHEYKEKVIENIGKNKEQRVRDDISADHVRNNPPTNEIIITGNGDVLCLDSLSGRYFKSDIEKIRKTVNQFNHDLMSDMFLTLNELYAELGLDGTDLGRDLGWNVDSGLMEIDFSSQITDDGTPCLVLNYSIPPTTKYR